MSKVKVKPHFIRVKPELYEKIKSLSVVNDRSINKMANILIKESIEKREGVNS